ncbi:putative clathrin assembly protein [Forsythia ovata]|uniref:Clathrin assembly protein n=1 Tax=Forsythia ovata TaxID=205694 RepID=A0ABD1SR64_9LAMI
MNEDEIPPLLSANEPVDLLGLNEVNPKAIELEESNALALAIIQPGNNPPLPSNALSEIGKTSGWELALVTAPSNHTSRVAETKLNCTSTKCANGNDVPARTNDDASTSAANDDAAAANMMMLVPHQNTAQYSQQQMPQMVSSNPFGDPFSYPPISMPPQGNYTLL